MTELTPNYKLTKPGQDEYYDVNVFNANADIIDAQIKKSDEQTIINFKQLEDRIAIIEKSLYSNITANPFTITYNTLTNTTTSSGIWNSSSNRLEC